MDALKASFVLFVASLLQLSVLTEYSSFRTASIVLVALLAIASLRGAVFGAVAGFLTGLLLDTATLGTLGVTSLLLTVGGSGSAATARRRRATASARRSCRSRS
jgi:rod shape-determining protein MreD